MAATIRQATPCDAIRLAGKLRQADVAELRASSGHAPFEALRLGIEHSHRCYVAEDAQGEPFAIFGIVPAEDATIGLIWMVATDDLPKHSRQFLRECKEWIDQLCDGYKLCYNYTDARNTVHHAWIKWAGFTIIKRHEGYGVEKRPFLEFVRITGAPYV